MNTEEERMRFVLSVLPLEVLLKLAVLVDAVSKAGFGDVSIQVKEGKPFLVQVTTSQKIVE